VQAIRGAHLKLAAKPYPQYFSLLERADTRALSRRFLQQGACMLYRSGFVAEAALANSTLADGVTVWPQVLSYSTQELMPTGRESSLPDALLRGIYIVESSSEIQLILYDPRGPLDAMEVQDALPDMYRCTRHAVHTLQWAGHHVI
jgi:hypothetical protein